MRASNRIIRLKDVIEICSIEGCVFDISARLNLPASVDGDTNDDIVIGESGYTYTGFRTGDKPIIFFSRKLSYSDVGVIAYIYRDATFVDSIGGTEITDFRNSNDLITENSQVVINSDLLADGISSGSVLTLGEETFKREFIFGNLSNQGSGDFIETLDRPVLAKPNTQYLLIFKNISKSAVQQVGSHLSWAEPSSVPGLELVDGVWKYTGVTL